MVSTIIIIIISNTLSRIFIFRINNNEIREIIQLISTTFNSQRKTTQPLQKSHYCLELSVAPNPMPPTWTPIPNRKKSETNILASILSVLALKCLLNCSTRHGTTVIGQGILHGCRPKLIQRSTIRWMSF